MKIRRIKKIRISDIEYKVEWKKGTYNAGFDMKKKLIEIGTEGDEVQMLAIIIHELKEILHIEQSSRYVTRHDDSYIFVYDHGKHEEICNRLAGLLNEFIM